MGVLAGSRIGIPGNSRKKLLSALLVPQETLAGTSRRPAALARAGKLAATHRRVVSKKRRRNSMANSKDVVVTGVSTGIGWGTTRVLVSKGFRVFGSVRKQAD